jgi:hypothetical protein
MQILAIQGYVGLHTIPLPAAPRAGGPTIAAIGMISRLGWKRAGTRFNTRGVDDVSNWLHRANSFDKHKFRMGMLQTS